MTNFISQSDVLYDVFEPRDPYHDKVFRAMQNSNVATLHNIPT